MLKGGKGLGNKLGNQYRCYCRHALKKKEKGGCMLEISIDVIVCVLPKRGEGVDENQFLCYCRLDVKNWSIGDGGRGGR